MRPGPFAWVWRLIKTDLIQAVTYPIEFWSEFLGSLVIDLGVTYSIWKAIFEENHTSEMNGYSLSGLVLYQTLAVGMGRATRGQESGAVAEEIYKGTLSRFLVYPVPFFPYKLANHLTTTVLALGQTGIAVIVLIAATGLPSEAHFTATGLIAGGIAVFAAAILYQLMTAWLELAAFWLEVVWSLTVMLRFGADFLGGGMVPLAFFPAWAQMALQYTPFPGFFSVPIGLILGRLPPSSLFTHLPLMIGWTLIVAAGLAATWKRGLRQYTGVGA